MARSDLEVAHSSSEEEEEEGSESESEAEEEEEEIKKPESTQTPSIPKPDSESDDESGSESESDSDLPPDKSRKADPNIKPIASKPMEQPPSPPKPAKKPRSKPSVPTSPPPAKPSTGAKRPVESDDVKESKRAKKVSEEGKKNTTGDDSNSKKQLFQRLWSEDDEIVLLKGMSEYTAKKGADPVADMNAFHDFIKKSLHIDVSKTQLQDKVRRLKKKFENNADKENKGKDRKKSNPHEQKAYELSKKVWGDGAISAGIDTISAAKVNGTPRKNNQRVTKVSASPKVDVRKEVPVVEFEQSVGPSRSFQLGRSIADSNVEEMIVRDGLELIPGPKRMEMEEKWKCLRVEEVEVYLKRVELICEQTKLVLEAIKSPGQ